MYVTCLPYVRVSALDLTVTSVFYSANEYLDKYDELEKKGSGTADVSGLFDFLKELKTMSGRSYDDAELETSIMGVAGEDDRSVDKTKFIKLVKKIKLTRH